MKIFDSKKSSWSERVNFIDNNNVFIGFDFSSCCCENFGYEFVKNLTDVNEKSYDVSNPLNPTESELEPYLFDVEFFEQKDKYDERNYAIFKLVHKQTRDDIYLVLYNHHNGYYSHGFEMSVGGTTFISGSL